VVERLVRVRDVVRLRVDLGYLRDQRLLLRGEGAELVTDLRWQPPERTYDEVRRRLLRGDLQLQRQHGTREGHAGGCELLPDLEPGGQRGRRQTHDLRQDRVRALDDQLAVLRARLRVGAVPVPDGDLRA